MADEVSEASAVTLEVGVELGGVDEPVGERDVPVGLKGGEPVGLAVWVDEVGVEETDGSGVGVPVGIAPGVPVAVEEASGVELSVGV